MSSPLPQPPRTIDLYVPLSPKEAIIMRVSAPISRKAWGRFKEYVKLLEDSIVEDESGPSANLGAPDDSLTILHERLSDLFESAAMTVTAKAQLGEILSLASNLRQMGQPHDGTPDYPK